MSKFHLAFSVENLESTRAFYSDLLQCAVGREAETWVDFDFFGHQISAHIGKDAETLNRGHVDGKTVKVPHFGVILEWDDWEKLVERLDKASVEYIIKPHVRFVGQPGEQGTFFIEDPSGNALEFKTFRDFRDIFATE